jgi:hypothetical protein
MHITNLIYLNETELNEVLKNSSDEDILRICLTLPDEVFYKIQPHFRDGLRLKALDQKNFHEPIPVSLINESEERILIEMRKLFVK